MRKLSRQNPGFVVLALQLWARGMRLADRMSHEFATELSRLNSARMGKDELLRLAPRDRVRAVKAALMRHHRGAARCC